MIPVPDNKYMYTVHVTIDNNYTRIIIIMCSVIITCISVVYYTYA